MFTDNQVRPAGRAKKSPGVCGQSGKTRYFGEMTRK
jgi:hypothetical protein